MEMIKTILTSGIIAAIVSAVVAVWQSRRTEFIKTVTNARKDYINELRKLSVDFAHTAILAREHLGHKEYKEQLHMLNMSIQLRLDPIRYHRIWDGHIISEMNEIERDPDGANIDRHVENFVILMQSLISFEWSGMMEEGKNGVLSDKKKISKRMEFWRQYIDHRNTITNND